MVLFEVEATSGPWILSPRALKPSGPWDIWPLKNAAYLEDGRAVGRMENNWLEVRVLRANQKSQDDVCVRIQEKMSFFLVSTERTHLSLQPSFQRV